MFFFSKGKCYWYPNAVSLKRITLPKSSFMLADLILTERSSQISKLLLSKVPCQYLNTALILYDLKQFYIIFLSFFCQLKENTIIFRVMTPWVTHSWLLWMWFLETKLQNRKICLWDVSAPHFSGSYQAFSSHNTSPFVKRIPFSNRNWPRRTCVLVRNPWIPKSQHTHGKVLNVLGGKMPRSRE